MSYDQFVRVYAEQFYEENNFGYDKANGDGVLLIDNWYREDDGRIYTWLCTTGKVKEAYDAEGIDHLLDNVYLFVEDNPYRAYKTYVNDFYHDMRGMMAGDMYLPGYFSWLVGLLAALIFVAVNWRSRKGEKTTTATTYVAGGSPTFKVRQDRFLRKSVVTHKIQTNNSSHGGGGGHSSGGHSGGGGSHGGGGHSR